MKNGIAMISKRSRLVNSFRPTIFGSTSERMNKYVSTERPSAIEIGMPHAISATSSANNSSARTVCDSSMTCSRAAKQTSASAIGMTTISAAVIASPSGRGAGGLAACKRAIIPAAPLAGAGTSWGAS